MSSVNCVVFDLDGTLLAGSIESRIALKSWLQKNNHIKVIFCTGRSISQCTELFDNPLIPKPDIWICDIGCSIYQNDLLL